MPRAVFSVLKQELAGAGSAVGDPGGGIDDPGGGDTDDLVGPLDLGSFAQS